MCSQAWLWLFFRPIRDKANTAAQRRAASLNLGDRHSPSSGTFVQLLTYPLIGRYQCFAPAAEPSFRTQRIFAPNVARRRAGRRLRLRVLRDGCIGWPTTRNLPASAPDWPSIWM